VAEQEFLLFFYLQDSVFKLSFCFSTWSASSILVHKSYTARHTASLGVSGTATK